APWRRCPPADSTPVPRTPWPPRPGAKAAVVAREPERILRRAVPRSRERTTAEEVMASDSPVNEAGWAEAGATEPPAHHLSAGTCRRRLAPDDPRQRETRHRREAASRKPGRALPRRDRVLVGGRGDPSSRSAT